MNTAATADGASCGTRGRTPTFNFHLGRAGLSLCALRFRVPHCFLKRRDCPLLIFFLFFLVSFFFPGKRGPMETFLILGLGNGELMRRFRDKRNGRASQLACRTLCFSPYIECGWIYWTTTAAAVQNDLNYQEQVLRFCNGFLHRHAESLSPAVS